MSVVHLVATAAEATTAPTWVAITGTVSAMITAIGVVIAGLFAYFKFVKGRTFYPRCSIDMRSEIVGLADSLALRVSIIARNESQVALLFSSDARQKLVIGQADAALWRQACEKRQRVRWERIEPMVRPLNFPEGELLDLLDEPDRPWWQWRPSQHWMSYLRGDKLEPGEQWARTRLIPMPRDKVAYLLRAEISACRHVALRHVIWHRLYCSNGAESRWTWSREICVLPEEFDSNGQRRKPRVARAPSLQRRSPSLPRLWRVGPKAARWLVSLRERSQI